MGKMGIARTEVYGLEHSLIASGYAMSTDTDRLWDEYADNIDKVIKRGSKLGSTPIGEGHDNFLKGIVVQADFTLPAHLWMQAMRYHWFEIISSQSKMHRLTQMDLDAQFTDRVMPSVVEFIKRMVEQYKADPTPERFETLLDNVPNGLLLTARVQTNYRQLKIMFNQRKNHRLSFWNTTFVNWCRELPHFSALTGCE